MYVVADRDVLSREPHRAYGNKILHLLYAASLCEKHGRDLLIPCDSNLDRIFDLSDFKSTTSVNVPCAFTERSAFKSGRLPRLYQRLARMTSIPLPFSQSVHDVIERSRKQYLEEASFLNGAVPSHSFSVKGHFWHYDLMPSVAAFLRFLKVREELVQQSIVKYPDLLEETAVAVHLRDTDFHHHLQHIFRHSIALDDEYYQASMSIAEKRIGGRITYHLFSDNPERIQRIFSDRHYVMHDDDVVIDWVSLHLAGNVIQSNSSFCWTASLYTKKLSIQPACGYNYHENTGSIPFGFLMSFSDVVAKGGKHVVQQDPGMRSEAVVS